MTDDRATTSAVAITAVLAASLSWASIVMPVAVIAILTVSVARAAR